MMTVAPAAAPKIAPSGAKPAVVVRATSGTVGQKKTSSPKLWNSKPPLLTTEPPIRATSGTVGQKKTSSPKLWNSKPPLLTTEPPKMAMPSIEPPVKEPEA